MNRPQSNILVVDDDQEVRELIGKQLRKYGFSVELAADGAVMRKVLKEKDIDLVVLDRYMPGEDGSILCQYLRRTSNTPIIMLTLLGSEPDLAGLEIDADDYIAKPFSPQELVSRIQTVLRRTRQFPAREQRNRRLSFCGWSLDVRSHVLTSPDEVVVTLANGEFELLLALAEHPGAVLNRDELLDLTSDRHGVSNLSIDMEIARLRHKLAAHAPANEIIASDGTGGYMIAVR